MKKILVCILLLLANSNVYAADLQKIQVHGFISQGYLLSDQYDYITANTEDGTFEFNEFGINGMVQITDDLRVGMQLLSRDLGEIGNNDVKIDWAYADYSFKNWLGIRAGRMKMKYGLYNQSRDIDAARTSLFLPTSVYFDESFRSIVSTITGVGIYGFLPGNISYEIQVGAADMSDAEGIESDSDNFAAGLEWETPLEGLKIGASYNRIGSSSDTYKSKVRTPVLSVEYLNGRFRAASEYKQTKLDMLIGGINYGATSEDYYIDMSYQFTDWFALGTCYSVAYNDKDDRDGDSYEAMGMPSAMAWLKDFSLTARFDINEYWLVKLEGHAMNGLKGAAIGDETDPDKNWFLFGIKTTVSF